jgi:hypothetical protein
MKESRERPHMEPEIIPPDRANGEPGWRQRARPPYVSTMTEETHRIYFGRLGPLGGGVLMLILGILAIVILFTVLGAVLLWIPIIALLIAAGAVYRLLLLRR